MHAKVIRQLTALAAAAVLILPAALPARAQETTTSGGSSSVIDKHTYTDYLASFPNAGRDVPEIKADPSTGFADADSLTADVDGQGTPGVVVEDGGEASLRVSVPQSGLYTLRLRYFTMKGKDTTLQATLTLDGETPFFEMEQVSLFRIWVDDDPPGSRQDPLGNDLIPSQSELYTWQDAYVEDHSGQYTAPYLFYLEKGEHIIGYKSVKEPVAIGGVLLGPAEELPAYEDVKKDYDSKGYQPVTDELLTIDAEKPARKSDTTLYARNDRSSPATVPYSASRVLLNVIGGGSWSQSGQWIEWEMPVEKSGLYRLSFRARQNLLSGASSSRRISIDGQVPFQEFEEFAFEYNSSWQNVTPDYWIYLEGGKTHTIRMEVTTGRLSEAIDIVDEAVYQLNQAYRQVIMITGTVPDTYRDYMLETTAPQVFEIFQAQADALRRCDELLVGITGKRGSVNGILQTMSRQLEKFVDKPELVQKQVSNFKDNIGALSTWLINIKQQSLELDSLYLHGDDAKLPKADGNIFQKIWHEAKVFFYSFVIDYSYIGGQEGVSRRIEVWTQAGRDQSTILRELSSRFTDETGIGVDIKLVTGQLLSATVAGRGPDVALQVGNTDPVNFATRGAAVDLTAFGEGDTAFDVVKERFRPSALVPYQLGAGVYALPETQTFPVMYYRSDIFEELGIQPPETWKEVFKVLSILQKSNMTIGIPAPSSVVGAMDGMTSYLILLLQHGGSLYSEDNRQSALDESGAIDAFKQWCSLYIDYDLPLKYDAATRFRSGEMPLIIADFTLYNNLSVAAPEIRGLWSIAPVPGTQDGEGIRHDAAAVGISCMMLSDCEDKEAAWAFMEWWTRAETQTAYGREMENRLGESARYPSANVEAFSSMSWPADDYAMLESQWQFIHGTPEVPGGYFTSRHINNAFRRVLYYNEDPKETLIRYTRSINLEIEQKRQELKLD